MKKKVILGIFALVCLSSFVVLGSSPKLVNKLLETMQNNPITRVFSSSNQPVKQKKTDEKSKQLSMIEEAPAQEISQTVLWHAVFNFTKTIGIETEKLNQEGQDGRANASLFGKTNIEAKCFIYWVKIEIRKIF